MNIRKWIGGLAAAVLFVLGATSAWAQDYTVTAVTGQWVTPPSNAVNLGISGDDSVYRMSTNTAWNANSFPPFPLSVYGASYSSMTSSADLAISTNGLMMFGTRADSGCCSPSSGPFTSTYDGAIGLAWTDLHSGSAGGTVKAWTDGTAPNRRFIIAYTNWSTYGSQANGTLNMQVQFYETGSSTPGRIVIAYTGAWSYSSSYGVCIDEFGGSRFIRPPAPGTSSGLYTFSTPPNDWQFDPNVTNFSGRLAFDEIVSDASGVGVTQNPGRPMPGVRMELRNGTGAVVGVGYTDGDGNYTVGGMALPSAGSGSIWATTDGLPCLVASSPGGTAFAKQILSSVSFGTSINLGTYVLTDTTDAGQAFRAPAQIAATIGAAYSHIGSVTSRSLGRLNVVYDPASSLASSWNRAAGVVPTYLRISSAASGDVDAYDRGKILRGYARQIMLSWFGAATGVSSLTLDAQGDELTGAADGLGSYLNAVIYGATSEYDGRTYGSSQTTAFNYETPSLVTAKGPTVGGWFSAAMYDLVDAANESHDTIDGSGLAAVRPLTVLAGLSQLSMVDFVYGWQSAGYDGAGLVTNFIYHGVLSDDSAEPNDTSGTATDLGSVGAIRRGQVLASFNEDWYKIAIPEAVDAYFVDVVYNAAVTTAQVTLEVYQQGGGLIATGSYNNTIGALRALTPPLQPTTLIIRVAHVGGGYLGTYDLQMFSSLSMRVSGATEWTLNRAIAQPLAVKGGIPPYTLAAKASDLPPGLALDRVNSRVFGTPIALGATQYKVSVTDSGQPANTYELTASLLVNDELRFAAPPLTGIAVGKPTFLSLGRVGGTNPVAITNFVGSLPDGLSLTPNLDVTGTTQEAGGGRISFDATDLAGSAAHVDTSLVACEYLASGRTVLPLGAGKDAASGFYFDALAGSTVSASLKTNGRNPRRSMNVLIVGPSGNAVQGGKVKIKNGSATFTKVPLPTSGRYFFVFSGKDEGGASQLLASLKITLPKKGGGYAELDFGDTIEFDFGALDGATFTMTGRTTLNMKMRVVFLYRPDGSIYPFEQITATESGPNFKFVVPIDQSGTWTMIAGHKPGPVGEVNYTYTIKQPKGGVYHVPEND